MGFRDIEPGVWKAEKEGDEIIGKLVKVGESSKYGKGKVYHLEVTENGKVENKAVFGSKVLDDRMSFVSVGDIVRIRYEGEQETKKGQNAKIYKVSVFEADDDDGDTDEEADTEDNE